MVATNIADDTEPVFGVIRDRAAEAVLVESAGTAEAEIRIAAGDVDGLCAGRSCEQKKAQTKQDEFIHRITILSDVRFAGSFVPRPVGRRVGSASVAAAPIVAENKSRWNEKRGLGFYRYDGRARAGKKFRPPA